MLSACSNTDSEYFPLGKTISWEYAIETKSDKVKAESRLIASQLEKIKVNGKHYYPFRYANGETVFYSKNETDIVFAPEPEQPSLKLMPYTQELNTRWQSVAHVDLLKSRQMYFSAGGTFGLDDIKLENQIVSFDEKINVPAGVFRETMRIDSKARIDMKERTQGVESMFIEESSWYAKGIGLVKKIRMEYSYPEAYRVEQVTELKEYKN